MKQFLMGTAATLLLAPYVALAQPAPATQDQAKQSPQQAQARPSADNCLGELQAFREKMQKDGLWLSGYRTGYGWSAYGPNRTAPVAPATTGTRVNNTGTAAGAPWGGVNWTVPPMQQLRTLHGAALVMAQRGDQQGCETVLSEMREVYGEYGQQLRQAVGDQGLVSTYRQRQLANAQPIGKMTRSFRADNITGTDVRSPTDEYLGSVEDVVVDPNSGQITYLILSHGGFMGVGEDYIAVPWDRLRASPNMDIFVLSTTESALEKAPKVDLDAFSNQQTYDQRRQEVDRFWQQQKDNKAG